MAGGNNEETGSSEELPSIGGLGVGVIGCGYWGINYVRLLRELLEVETIVVCDERQTRLKMVEESFSGVMTTTDIADVLDAENIHCVIVATPATAHYEVTKRVIEAGKHVLIEKPITTNSAEAEELIALADDRGLTLAVGHTFLHNAAVRKVKEYVDTGEVGDVHYLYSRRTNLGPIRHDVNALWDLAPHDISMFNYLLGGMPHTVSAVGARPLLNGGEDVGFVSLTYAGGLVAHIHVSWVDPFKVREMVVVGSECRVVFDDVNPTEPVRLYRKGVTPLHEGPESYAEASYLIKDGDILSPKIDTWEPLKRQVIDFFSCMSLGTRPISDGVFGLEVVDVMLAIEESMVQGGAPVAVRGADEPSAVPPLASVVTQGGEA